MDSFEFSLAVEFSLVHLDPDLIRFRFHFLPGGIQHARGAEINDAADLVPVQGTDEIPDFRIDAECIIGVSEEQDVYRFTDRRADRLSLHADCLGNRFRKTFCVSCLCIVSDCNIHDKTHLSVLHYAAADGSNYIYNHRYDQTVTALRT